LTAFEDLREKFFVFDLSHLWLLCFNGFKTFGDKRRIWKLKEDEEVRGMNRDLEWNGRGGE
jgi:hypothetical protein